MGRAYPELTLALSWSQSLPDSASLGAHLLSENQHKFRTSSAQISPFDPNESIIVLPLSKTLRVDVGREEAHGR